MDIIKFISERFNFLEFQGMSADVECSCLFYKYNDVSIEFCYNSYDYELTVTYCFKENKCSLLKLLFTMGISQYDEVSIICTSEDYCINRLEYYANILKNAIKKLIDVDDAVIEAYCLMLNNQQTLINYQRDKEIDLKIMESISKKQYSKALELLQSKRYKTEKDLKKEHLLKYLISS